MKRILLCILSALTVALPRIHADNLFRNGDVLEMRLSGPPEELIREFNLVLTVDEGSINLPLIGHVTAAGMSGTQLASIIERRLKQERIFTVATVNINSNPQRTIIVGGSVRSPGKQTWIPGLTLTGAISAAGGPNDFPEDGIKIIRDGKAMKFSRKAIKKNPALDPKVEPGDMIELEGS